MDFTGICISPYSIKFQKIYDSWISGLLDIWILGFLDSWISVFLDSLIFLASSIPFLKYVPSYLRSTFLPVSTPAMPSFLSLFGCTLESHHCWQSPFILQWIIARLHSQIEKGVELHCWWTIMGFFAIGDLKKKSNHAFLTLKSILHSGNNSLRLDFSQSGVRSCVSSPFSRCTPVLDWSE